MVVITVAFPSPARFFSIGAMLKAARHGDPLDIKPSTASSGFALHIGRKGRRTGWTALISALPPLKTGGRYVGTKTTGQLSRP